MSKIGDLFVDPVDRQIEEVIKVDQTDEKVIAGEIGEYIATDSICRNLLAVLERFEETPRKPHEGAAVWVSGFFGSGKSSFAKFLGLALENREILGEPAGRRLARRIGDKKLDVVLNTISEKIPTHAVVFDVSTDRGIRSGGQMLTEIMYQLFLESLGYAKEIDLAELEIGLEARGQLEQFEAAYRAKIGKEWRAQRSMLAFAANEASAVMHELEPAIYPLADSWAKGRAKPNMTPGQFAERVDELMNRRKPGHALVFVVDEVGQFVARDVQKMLDLQAIVQSLGRIGRGKYWTIVTSQEKLSELVSGLDDKKIELARLMDRFPLQVHLEPSDISEVTSKRVLRKGAGAETALGRLFDANRARLEVNSRISANVRLPELSRERFIDLYPLLPYQIDLVIDVVSGLRTQAGASRHVGGANRTIIKLAQQLLINPATRIADQEVGRLVRLDQVYDLVSSNIASEIRGKIGSIPERTNHKLAQAVAKVVCLLQFVKVPRTPENIAAALIETVDADSKLQDVHEALAELKKGHFVREGDDGYRIPTPAEDDWEKTRLGVDPRRGDERQLYAGLISDLWTPHPEFTLGETKVFKAGLMIDGSEKVTGDITFHLQLSDPGEDFVREAEALRTRSRSERSTVFWAVALDEEVRREAREAFRSAEMIKRAEREVTGSERVGLLAEEKIRLRRHQAELQRRLRAACLAGKIYFQGNDRSPAPGVSEIRKVAVEVLRQSLPVVYDRFSEASAKRNDVLRGVEALLRDENLNGLPRVFTDLGLLKDEGGRRVFNLASRPLAEVLGRIQSKDRYGEQATGKYLTETFLGAPFGWDFDCVKLLVLSLLRAGAVEGNHHGQTLEVATSLAAKQCFENNQAFRLASFRERKGIDFAVLAQAAQSFRETFGVEAREMTEPALAAEIRKKVAEDESEVGRALRLLQVARLPGEDALEAAYNDMALILRGGDANAITTFNAAHRSIKDAIKRANDLARAMSDDGQGQIEQARRALRLFAVLEREPDFSPDLAETGAELTDLLSKETFFRDLNKIQAAAHRIDEAFAERRSRAVAERAQAYREALAALRATPGFAELDPAVQAEIARPLEACADETNAPDSLDLLRSETDACPSRRDAAIRRVLEEIEGERLATISVGQYFVGGIETEEQLDQALNGMRDELSRLIGEGKKVIVQ